MNILQANTRCKLLNTRILRSKYPRGGRGVPTLETRRDDRKPASITPSKENSSSGIDHRRYMATINQDDFIRSVADALQYISFYHPVDYITNLARAYET